MSQDRIKCVTCGEDFDPEFLSEVVKHFHENLPLDDVMGIQGKKVEEPT